MDVVAGIDVGGTDTKFGLVDQEGHIHSFATIPTRKGPDFKLFFQSLSKQISDLVENTEDPCNFVGVSIAAPTGSQLKGTIEDASNLDWPRELPVAELLRENFNLPVAVSNDANAAAVGELLFGSARNSDDFICITLGTGLGAGIVANGKLLQGSQGLAGEAGHMLAMIKDRKCGCGKTGCLETYVSATGIVRTAADLLKSGEYDESSLLNRGSTNFSSMEITKAALEGDRAALRAFDITGEVLGQKLADITALLNPDLFVLTGGLSRAGHLLLDPVKAYFDKYVLDMYKNGVEVVCSEIDNENPAVLGAAAILWHELQT